MLIYDTLKNDHDTIKNLMLQLVNSADADEATRKQLIEQVRDELVPHARAEEAVLYNSLRSMKETKDIVKESFKEHAEAETLLRKLQGMEAFNSDWTKTAQNLRDALEHHISEEETRLFTEARSILSDEEARQMNDAFIKLKPEAREQSFMKNTLDMVANMMPKRFSDSMRGFTDRS